jgi:sulfur relay (sulfurtransferase) DsrC/TusE family protein
MKKYLLILVVVIVNHVLADQWDSYAEFEVDATNAIANISFLMSDRYTNQLYLCRNEVDPTNEVSSAALLMLALSDDVKSNNVEELVGDTNSLSRVAWFLTCPNHKRTQWQKICAITMLSTSNKDVNVAEEYFNVATNALKYWDTHENCFSGGELYKSIARYFGSSELNPRMCLIFAATVSAKKAGMVPQYRHYLNLLPEETRNFVVKGDW